jgi:uncharacterized protein YndB with AHSA1/START domain
VDAALAVERARRDARTMAEPRTGFTVEQELAAGRETVWRALTDPDELRRWFGWDYPGLEHEIRFIFLEHAAHTEPDRIDMRDGQAIELTDRGGGTVVRAVRPGPDPPGDEPYDGMREGWRAFFVQLAHLLERAPGQDRRTLYLTGQGSPQAVADRLGRAVDGPPVAASRFGRAVLVPGEGPAAGSGVLAVLDAREPLDASGPARMTLTVSAHGVDGAAWAAIEGRWTAWWAEAVSTQAPGG